MKTALVLGAGGFIGSHMVKRLKAEGYWVRGVDIRNPEFDATHADHFVSRDLTDYHLMKQVIGYAGCNRNPYETYNMDFDKPFDEVYQYAAHMGGAGFISSGKYDAEIVTNSALINLNLLKAVHEHNTLHRKNQTRIYFPSSACVYADGRECLEENAYPAMPDNEYGWEKLFAERLYLDYQRNHGIPVRIGRFHNIYGPFGDYDNGKEKVPAAICRKVAKAQDGGEVEVWGDGKQTRSFLYIDDCIEATRKLILSDFSGPVNIGSEDMISINDFTHLVADISGKKLTIKHIDGPRGAEGRNSQNDLIRKELDWDQTISLRDGITKTYNWINEQVNK